jgi:competence protein ComEC
MGVSSILQGYLCSVPKKRELYAEAEFCLLSFDDERTPDGRILLRWKDAVALDVDQQMHRLKVSLKPPRGTVNPVGGSYEKYLFYKRLIAVGTVIEIVALDASEARLRGVDFIRQCFTQYRIQLSKQVNKLTRGLEHGGLLKALIIGDRSDISLSDNRILSETGTQHLMAISGLHVGVILFFFFRLLPKNTVSFAVISLLGLFYISLVGFSASSQRAWVMSMIGLLFILGYWPIQKWRAYVLALFLVLVLDPLSSLNMGFWFSFLCVAFLLLISEFSFSDRLNWRAFFAVQFLLILALMPITASFGMTSSFVAGLANAIAIPWVSLLILPFSLMAFLGSYIDFSSAGYGLFVLDLLMHGLMQYLSSLDVLCHQLFIEASPLTLIAYYLCLGALIILGRFRVMFLSYSLLLVSFLFSNSRLDDRGGQLVVFDAGQGLAIAMIWAGQYWLYDTGPAFGRYSTKDGAIIPYLKRYGLLDKIGGVIVSHGDADHSGGLADLFLRLEPKIVWSGEPGRIQKIDVLKFCDQRMAWQHHDGMLEVLYPFEGVHRKTLSSNNHSCVVRFTLFGQRFLLMGDLEGEAEMALVKRYRHELKADVLIAGHHGSGNASSYALLKHVRPDVVVFSAGYMNRFNHPAKGVLKRVSTLEAKMYNTANDGAVLFSFNPESDQRWKVTTYRNKDSPFWLLK